MEEEVQSTCKISGAPNGIRIRAAGLKGRCPRPLDDGGTRTRRGIIPVRERGGSRRGSAPFSSSCARVALARRSRASAPGSPVLALPHTGAGRTIRRRAARRRDGLAQRPRHVADPAPRVPRGRHRPHLPCALSPRLLWDLASRTSRACSAPRSRCCRCCLTRSSATKSNILRTLFLCSSASVPPASA